MIRMMFFDLNGIKCVFQIQTNEPEMPTATATQKGSGIATKRLNL
jgi:hypothetical protein